MNPQYESCQECGAPLDRQQRYCVNCAARRSDASNPAARYFAAASRDRRRVGATASVALRNVILGLGAVAMMVVTSPKLSGLVIAAIPLIVLPLVAFGRSVRRKSRLAQDTLANATAYASEQIGAVRTLQAFTNEGLVTGRFSRAVEAAFDAAKADFETLKTSWTQAASDFAAGNVAEAVRKARGLKAQADDLATKLEAKMS